MTTIELPNGAEATLQDGVWTSSTLGLANMLERIMVDCSAQPADDDPEYARARLVASRVSGRIIDHTPS